MSWWKKVTNFWQWSVSNDTKDVEDRGEQEGKEIFSGAYTKQKPPKYETEMETVRARNKKGRYLADDKSTPDVNEAYVKRKKKK